MLEDDKDLQLFRETIERYTTKEFLFVTFTSDDSLFSEHVLKKIIQLRDAMLKQLEPFDTPEKIKKLKKLVDASSDTLRKLAGLAARIQIIRSS